MKPGYRFVTLFDEMLVAVHKPPFGGAHDAGSPQLITTDPEEGRLGLDWDAYCAQAGTRREAFAAGPFVRCTHYLLALEIAKAGMGVALVPDFLAAESLSNGSLAYFDKMRLSSGRTYRFCFKNARAGDPVIGAAARWMKMQAGSSVIPLPIRRSARP